MTRADVPWRGRYLEVRVEGRWEYAARPGGMGAAIIIPIDDSADGRHIILIEEYRVPLGRWCIGFPAGLIGDEHSAEGAAIAAARELEEEAGYGASTWTLIGDFASSPGLTDETVTIFVARDLTCIAPGGGVDGEDIRVHRVPMAGIGGFLAAKRAEGCAIDVKLLALLGQAVMEQALDR
jgi:ADP-ribose pyrophosphatase